MSNTPNTDKCAAIASLLGGTSAPIGDIDDAPGAIKDQNRFYITLVDGVRLFVRFGGYSIKGRIAIGTAYPLHKSGDGYNAATGQRDFDRSLSYQAVGFTGITVSDTKTAEAIAKDIERRFLPEYRPLYQKAVAWVATHAAYKSLTETTTADVTKAFVGVGDCYVDSVNGDSVSLKFYGISKAKALALADFLRTFKE